MSDSKLIVLDHQTSGAEEQRWLDAYRAQMVGQEYAIRHLVRDLVLANAFGGQMRDPSKPAAVFFGLGPSGVGKTRIVEVTSLLLFGAENAFTKIDCSELQHSHEIARLIGSPPGYIRSDEEPLLSQRHLDMPGFVARLQDPGLLDKFLEAKKIREQVWELWQRVVENENARKKAKDAKTLQPLIKAAQKLAIEVRQMNELLDDFLKKNPEIADMEEAYDPHKGHPSILLLDEIEKADPAVWRLLLQVLDKATLTLHGKVKNGSQAVRFHNTLIFFSSNVGQERIRKLVGGQGGMGFSSKRQAENLDTMQHANENIRQQIYRIGMQELRKSGFTTEFIGRVGKEHFYAFAPFTPFELGEALDRIIIPSFKKNLICSLPVQLQITPKARAYIIEEAMDTENRALNMRAVLNVFTRRVREELFALAAKTETEGGIIPGDEIVIDAVEGKERKFEIIFSRTARTQPQRDAAVEKIAQQKMRMVDRIDDPPTVPIPLRLP